MKIEKNAFVCQNCGFQLAKWQGQCPNCGQWNTLVETIISQGKGKKNSSLSKIKPISLVEVESLRFSRLTTGLTEFGRVLGGGIVPGSVV